MVLSKKTFDNISHMSPNTKGTSKELTDSSIEYKNNREIKSTLNKPSKDKTQQPRSPRIMTKNYRFTQMDKRSEVLSERLAALQNKHCTTEIIEETSPQAKTILPMLLLNEPSQESLKIIQESV